MEPMRDITSESGVSLLELVIGVAIIALFAGLGFKGFQDFTDHARKTTVDRAANEMVTMVLAEDTKTGNSPIPDIQKIQEDYNSTSEEVQVDVQKTSEHIIVTARGWDDRYIVTKVLDKDGNMLQPSDPEYPEIETPDPGNSDETPEPPERPDFLDNPSQDPVVEVEAEIKKDRARQYAEEVLRRGMLYEELYDPELHATELGEQWEYALGGSDSGLGFLDPWWGAFTVGSEYEATAEEFNMWFVVVITGDGDAYYLLRDGYEMTPFAEEYFSFFDAQPF